MKYNLNTLQHIKDSLPSFLRGTKLVNFMRLMLYPLQTLNSSFVLFAHDSIYFANLTPQSILLEKFLNDQFDNDLRRIKIFHFEKAGLFIGLKSEGETGEYFGLKIQAEIGVYVPLKDEDVTDIGDANIDFKVIVPNGIDPNTLGKSLDPYKPASKRYSITTS